MELLLQFNADVDIVDNRGRKPSNLQSNFYRIGDLITSNSLQRLFAFRRPPKLLQLTLGSNSHFKVKELSGVKVLSATQAPTLPEKTQLTVTLATKNRLLFSALDRSSSNELTLFFSLQKKEFVYYINWEQLTRGEITACNYSPAYLAESVKAVCKAAREKLMSSHTKVHSCRLFSLRIGLLNSIFL